MMTDNKLVFLDYCDLYFEECIALFDKNCPEFFANNERQDYVEFLEKQAKTYKIGQIEGKIVAVFGLDIDEKNNRASITWIMTCPSVHGKGLGTQMISYAKNIAVDCKVTHIDIATSHLLTAFFEKFGAKKTTKIKDGWGPNMHRVDMVLPLL
ncbi:GNAT family N-acetyltransferase [Shewanella polaris]|uniref:GNAT family N-acetyltransferase n=1 Tax=Shewanella polaris TaxID=2588449 RepID=A0A4Y5YGR0_9GAMM|nr:GNAT family N-acetyltransferase [Shewanella polaris]QDE31982.1 GNAT family N-acetyltransferase [Shewanella polaris]